MRRALVVTMTVLLGCSVAWAQTGAAERQGATVSAVPGGPGPSWGTSGTAIAKVSVVSCSTMTPGSPWNRSAGTDRYLTFPDYFVCPLYLPSGASILGIELEACDTSTTGEVWAVLGYASGPGSPFYSLDQVTTGSVNTFGCARFQQQIAPHTVDNGSKNYYFEVWNTSYDGSTTIQSVRVYYSLQVSPAPATASFADVPTSSPYFRFVEALASAGIVGGCGGGNYCPNNAVTRGQIAVFLAVALGMNYPN
jgi:hypothetical protein